MYGNSDASLSLAHQIICVRRPSLSIFIGNFLSVEKMLGRHGA